MPAMPAQDDVCVHIIFSTHKNKEGEQSTASGEGLSAPEKEEE